MAVTYEPIATQTLTSAAASMTFTSIPGTYTDLRLVFVSATNTGDWLVMQMNSDATVTYGATYMSGSGAAASSARWNNKSAIFVGTSMSSTTAPQMTIVDIFSYAGAKHKSILSQSQQNTNGVAGDWVRLFVGTWANTAAITSLTLSGDGALNLASGTTATLYGILKA